LPRKNLRVALVSMKHILGDVDFNLKHHRMWFERCLKHKPDFIGFPEFSLTGWVEKKEQALGLNSAPVKEIESWAKKRRVCVATCLVEKRGGRLYNACVIAGPKGRIGVMRKINLVSSEARHYEAGREFPVFDVAGCKMGVNTCADATRYEMMRVLSFRGAEVIFAPHANSLKPYGNSRAGWVKWRMETWPFFARHSRVAIAGCSCAGLFGKPREGEEETKYCGGAMVMDWEGKPVKRAGGKTKRETLIVADIDLADLREARKNHDPEFRPDIVYNRPTGWVLGSCGK